MKEEIKQLLKENLKVKIEKDFDWDGSNYLVVFIEFDGEKISEDRVLTEFDDS